MVGIVDAEQEHFILHLVEIISVVGIVTTCPMKAAMKTIQADLAKWDIT
jgi:hypothetical protein